MSDLDWELEFSNKFAKHYEGILPLEVIEESVKWHIDFMRPYIETRAHSSEANGFDMDRNPIQYGITGGNATQTPTQGLDENIIFGMLISKFPTFGQHEIVRKQNELSCRDMAQQIVAKFTATQSVRVPERLADET